MKPNEEKLLDALKKARKALQFYADQLYGDKCGVSPEVQWIAENTIKEIDPVIKLFEVQPDEA